MFLNFSRIVPRMEIYSIKSYSLKNEHNHWIYQYPGDFLSTQWIYRTGFEKFFGKQTNLKLLILYDLKF